MTFLYTKIIFITRNILHGGGVNHASAKFLWYSINTNSVKIYCTYLSYKKERFWKINCMSTVKITNSSNEKLHKYFYWFWKIQASQHFPLCEKWCHKWLFNKLRNNRNSFQFTPNDYTPECCKTHWVFKNFSNIKRVSTQMKELYSLPDEFYGYLLM